MVEPAVHNCVEASGRLYGRGACDMKGFDACVLAMAPAFRDAGLKRPVHIVLSYDEETTCLGSLDIIARFGKDEPLPAAVIVGEPTMMAVADAHKSVATFRTLVTGHEAHSALPALGANAVAAAADVVSEIGRLARAYEEGPLDPRFTPPYSTLHVGMIRGGTARNILARECVFHWEFRGLPGVTTASAMAKVQAFIDEVATPRLTRFVSGPTIATTMEVDVPPLAADARLRSRSARAAAHPLQQHDRGFVRHRGRAFSGGRPADHRVRAGLDRPGAQARRIRGRGAARGLPRIPRAPRRGLGALTAAFASWRLPESIAALRQRSRGQIWPFSRRIAQGGLRD